MVGVLRGPVSVSRGCDGCPDSVAGWRSHTGTFRDPKFDWLRRLLAQDVGLSRFVARHLQWRLGRLDLLVADSALDYRLDELSRTKVG